jgi:tetratricopeptide (TPR) repeat protein
MRCRNRYTYTNLAPDLWAIRTATYSLPTPAPDTKEYKVLGVGRPEAPIRIDVVTPAEGEWHRQYQAAREPGKVSVEDGLAAMDTALERGALQDAQQIAGQVVDVARQAVGVAPTDDRNARRGLSMALDGMGRVLTEIGDLEAARAAYQESLELRRELRAALGDAPSVLADLARVLGLWGSLLIDLKDINSARSAFTEGLALSRRLTTFQSDHPAYRKLKSAFEAFLAMLTTSSDEQKD